VKVPYDDAYYDKEVENWFAKEQLNFIKSRIQKTYV